MTDDELKTVIQQACIGTLDPDRITNLKITDDGTALTFEIDGYPWVMMLI